MKFILALILAVAGSVSFAGQDQDAALVARAMLNDQIKTEVDYFRNATVSLESVNVSKVEDLDTITLTGKNGNKDGHEVNFKCKSTILTITRSFELTNSGRGAFVYRAQIKGANCQ